MKQAVNTGKENGNRPGKVSRFIHRLHAVLLCGLLLFPTVFAGTAEAAAHETAPGMPRSLVYWAGGDEGQAYVSRLKQGKKEESEVDPAVVGRVAEIARRHKGKASPPEGGLTGCHFPSFLYPAKRSARSARADSANNGGSGVMARLWA